MVPTLSQPSDNLVVEQGNYKLVTWLLQGYQKLETRWEPCQFQGSHNLTCYNLVTRLLMGHYNVITTKSGHPTTRCLQACDKAWEESLGEPLRGELSSIYIVQNNLTGTVNVTVSCGKASLAQRVAHSTNKPYLFPRGAKTIPDIASSLFTWDDVMFIYT